MVEWRAVELSDCPHAVGTPEHSNWVKNTFIPAVSSERTRGDRAAYGAESIGGRYIDGLTHKPDGTPRDDVQPWVARAIGSWVDPNPDPEPFTQILMPRQRGMSWSIQLMAEEYEKLRDAIWGVPTSMIVLDDPVRDLSQVDRRARPKSRAERRRKSKKPTRPRRGPVKPNSTRQCPRHGGPAESCKFCRR